jgi:carbonic anhydrase
MQQRRWRAWTRMLMAMVSGLVAIGSGPAYSTEFQYSGDEGPGFWGELEPAWQDCATNQRQSPIEIHKAVETLSLGRLHLDLHATAIDLTNKGHTIEETYAAGSTITVDGVVYDLLQFHFHTLSEHVLRGERGVMELHAVFKNASSGDLVVIGQLYKIGRKNRFLAKFDQLLPVHKGDHSTSSDLINVRDAFRGINHYYTYPGSLTTPPCSPIVTWIVLKEFASMSKEQFERFNEILGNNFRPTQPLHGRTIREFF